MMVTIIFNKCVYTTLFSKKIYLLINIIFILFIREEIYKLDKNLNF